MIKWLEDSCGSSIRYPLPKELGSGYLVHPVIGHELTPEVTNACEMYAQKDCGSAKPNS